MIVLCLNAFLSRWYEIRRIHTFPSYEIAEIITFVFSYATATYAHSTKTIDVCLLGYMTCLCALTVNLNMSGVSFILSGVVFLYVSGQSNFRISWYDLLTTDFYILYYKGVGQIRTVLIRTVLVIRMTFFEKLKIILSYFQFFFE